MRRRGGATTTRGGSDAATRGSGRPAGRDGVRVQRGRPGGDDDAGRVPATYGYDATDQLTAADQTHPLLPEEIYSYDGVGNRLASHLSADYDYDDANQLLEDDQWDYAYNTNGRQVEKVEKATGDRWTYGYDAEDRLVTVRRYAGGRAIGAGGELRLRRVGPADRTDGGWGRTSW